MINGPVVFLILLAAIGWFGKNTSLIMAAGFLLSMKLIGLDAKVFPYLSERNQPGRYDHYDFGTHTHSKRGDRFQGTRRRNKISLCLDCACIWNSGCAHSEKWDYAPIT